MAHSHALYPSCCDECAWLARMATQYSTSMKRPFVIALLGAESTGKSQLANGLAKALCSGGRSVQLVSEYLREWCELHGRVPLQSEQSAIAKAQSDRIQASSERGFDVVIADTTAVMTAVYSDYVFEDRGVYADAIGVHKIYDLTLLMGLDVPWVADGIQRDGPHVRDAVDSLIRQALQKSGISAPTIYGLGESRLQVALTIVYQAMQTQQAEPALINRSVWRHCCDCCGDGECERRSVQLLQRG